jgi:hypothetical protein
MSLHKPFRISPTKRVIAHLLGSLLAIGSVWAAGAGYSPDSMASQLKTVVGGNCNIKGNISMNTGERIFHVPGQENYQKTRISLQHGERWFCSESEARKAGWRKAKR